MGLFSSFRTNSFSSSQEQQEHVVHEQETKQLLKERKKQQKAMLKQRKNEQKMIKKQQEAIKYAQKKEQQQRENEEKKIVKERKKLEKERKRAIQKELNAIKILHKQKQKESKQKEREVKKQMYRLQHAHKKQERARKRVLKKQLKEEKKRQRQLHEQQHLEYELEHHRMELAQSTVVVPIENPQVAPVFKNRLHCVSCHQKFLKFPTRSRHHCRHCGDSFCNDCLSTSRRVMPWIQFHTPQRICVSCDGILLEQENKVEPQRSLSLSEQPVSEEENNSSIRGIRLRSRSRSGSSKIGKKNSIWNLPIRPFLKRKESMDQLRNRTWDLHLQVEKAEQFAKRNNHEHVLGMTTTTLQPLIATAS